jgi:hypothetical protein
VTPRPFARVVPWLAPLGAAAGAAVLLGVWAPGYLFGQGFPLDDSWIHAVYARELARSGMLAYNPGVPATGETAPLWPVVLAPLHLLLPGLGAIVAATKLTGLALHAAACALLGRALAREAPDRWGAGAAAATLVALHPHLVAASVSGMEVPLAELVIAILFSASATRRLPWLAAAGAAAIGARPEVALIAVLLPALLWIRAAARSAVALSFASLAGALAALAALGMRNYAVSGMALPATFHAKANRGAIFDPQLQHMGFVDLLGQIPLLDHVAVLVVLIAIALIVHRKAATGLERAGPALFLSGMVFCAVSFALIPPVDPPAFYHQRYVLPGVMLAIAALPVLADNVLTRFVTQAPRAVAPVLALALAAAALAAFPARARHLANDARNIDDVQVAFGRELSSRPPTATVWAIDAGAIRFFGSPFVVDMIGLNTPELLGPDAQNYLNAHEPAYLDYFPGWSRIEVNAPVQLPARAFVAKTPYTVTSAASMRTHVLVTCTPPQLAGRFVVRGRPWEFRCSS